MSHKIHLIMITPDADGNAEQKVTAYDNEEDIDQEWLTELIRDENVVIIKGERLYPEIKNVLTNISPGTIIPIEGTDNE